MAKLYPPVIENTLPAFCLQRDNNDKVIGASIHINFELNKAVAEAEVQGIALRLRTISTNTYIATEENCRDNNPDVISGDANFILNIDSYDDDGATLQKLKVGQFYKAQVAFIDVNGEVGYFSTIGVIKCVAQPTATIAGYTAGDLNIITPEIIGVYTQDTSTGDSSEKVYSYRFQMWNDKDELIDDSTVLLHNSSADTSSFSSTDKFICRQILEDDRIYAIQYSVTTLNGLTVLSPVYKVIESESIDLEDDLTLIPKVLYDEGIVELQLCYRNQPITYQKPTTGSFILFRSSSLDNYTTWQEVQRFRLLNEPPSSRKLYDYTVEQGITYHYGIRQYNRQGFYSKQVIANMRTPEGNDIIDKETKSTLPCDVYVDFEDMFLFDGERQLKIRFNPTVNSFKNDLLEQKIETIGSKHPFIFRNGNVCYKEFPIGGLITFNQDNAQMFITQEDIEQMSLTQLKEYNREKTSSTSTVADSQSVTNLISDNIQLERYFKLLVLNWLTDGKPKLFRSATEGNYIVRLLNVNLIPKKELGRMIHEFTCTAYEIADFTYDNLLANHILTNEEPIVNSEQWGYLDVNELIQNPDSDLIDSDGFIQLRIKDKHLTAFSCINFAPGDEIKFLVDGDINPTTIIIGASGNYIYTEGKPISALWIKPNTDLGDGFSRDMNIYGMGYTFQYFDTVAAISTHTRIGEFYVGSQDDLFMPGVAPQQDLCNTIEYLPVSLTKDLYQRNKYYLYDSKNDQWYIDTSTEFSEDKKYYQKLPLVDSAETTWFNHHNLFLMRDESGILRGQKIKVNEILHLRAKKRIIIPIFKCLDNGDYENDTYFLTPYGQGYVRYKTIAEKINSQSIIEPIDKSFNIEEAFTLKDLTEVVMSQCNIDKYCIFHVYGYRDGEWQPAEELYSPFIKGAAYWNGRQLTLGPNITKPTNYISYDNPEALANFTEEQLTNVYIKPFYYLFVGPEAHDSGDNIYGYTGYYDPYTESWWKIPSDLFEEWNLYNSTNNIMALKHNYLQEFLNLPEANYNPTFEISYSTYDTQGVEIIQDNQIIDLSDSQVYEDYNLKPPSHLKLNNGITFEMTYRLQCIDYTMENEDDDIRELKQEYLQQRNKYIEYAKLYNNNKLLVDYYKYLAEENELELAKLTAYTQYRQTLEALISAAQNRQKNTIKNYWQDEYAVLSSLIIEVRNVLQDLIFNMEDSEDLTSLYDRYPELKELQLLQQQLMSYITESDEDKIKGYLIKDKQLSENIVEKDWPNDTSLTGTTEQKKQLWLSQWKECAQQHYYTDKDTTWSLDETVLNLVEEIKTTIQNVLNRLNKNIANLGNKRYVRQYIDNLQQEALSLISNGVDNEWLTYWNELKTPDDESYEIVKNGNSDRKLFKFSFNGTQTKIYLYRPLLRNIYQKLPNASSNIDELNALINGEQYLTLSDNSLWGKYISFNNNIDSYANPNGIYKTLQKNIINNAALKCDEPLQNNHTYNELYIDNGNNFTITQEAFKNQYASMFVKESESNERTKKYFCLNQIVYFNEDGTFEYCRSLLLEKVLARCNTFNDLEDENMSQMVYNDMYNDANKMQSYHISSEQWTYIWNYIKLFFKSEEIFNTVRQINDFYIYEQNVATNLNNSEMLEFIANLIKSEQDKIPYDELAKSEFDQVCELFEAQPSHYEAMREYIQNKNKLSIIKKKAQDICDNLLQCKMNVIAELKQIAASMIALQGKYRDDDDIAIILTSEQQAYNTANNSLKTAYENAQRNISALVSDPNHYTEAFYFELLKDYWVAESQNSSSEELEEQYQKIKDALNMATRWFITNTDTPKQLYQKVLRNAWRPFVAKLADAYKTEIKERFG